jgi:hypothetical protein
MESLFSRPVDRFLCFYPTLNHPMLLLLLQEDSLLAGGKQKYKIHHFHGREKLQRIFIGGFFCIFIHSLSLPIERIDFLLSIILKYPSDIQTNIHITTNCSLAYGATCYYDYTFNFS